MGRGQVMVGVAVLSALVLAGCGGDEEQPTGEAGTTSVETTTNTATTAPEPEGGRDEAAERDAAVAAVITGEPDAEFACGEAVTDHYVRRTYGDRDGCVAAQAPEALARSFSGLGFSIGGDRAIVTTTPRGGVYDGVELEITLVDDGERWRVDRLDADIPVGP